MSGGRQPQLPQGNFPFRAGDRVLFTLNFNVQTDNVNDFNNLIEQVTRELRNHLRNRWDYGNATVLPCPTTVGRRWIVIVLEARDREVHYRVPVFIDATTIYMHGYQNMAGTAFEFQPDSLSTNVAQQSARCLHDRSTVLSFSCNYIPMARATRQAPSGQGTGDPGFILEALPDLEQQRQLQQQRQQRQRQGQPPEAERYRPNFGRDRLVAAVRELAQENNTGSQHRTAQNLMLVIIRFCESIRNRSVQREMVDLWTVQYRVAATRPSYFPEPSRCFSATGILHIKNWSTTSSALINHIHGPSIAGGSGPTAPNMWPSDSANTMGVASAEEAQRILVVVLFSGDAEQRGTPGWRDDNNNNNQGRRRPRYADATGVITPQPVRRLVPEEPIMEILGVFIPNKRGRWTVNGICGSIAVTDNFGAQMIYRRGKNDYQHVSGNSHVWLELELNSLGRSISAYSCIDIDVDLEDQLMGNRLGTGQFSWNICNFLNNLYDVVLTATIGHARLMYIVYRKAVQVTVSVTVENCDHFSQGSVSTRSTYFRDNNRTPVGEEGLYLPIPAQQPMSRTVRPDGGPHIILYRQDIVVAPLDFLLKVTVSLLSDGSRRPVQAVFQLKPTEKGGRSVKSETMQQGATVKVVFAWNLLPWALQGGSSAGRGGTSAGQAHYEL